MCCTHVTSRVRVCNEFYVLDRTKQTTVGKQVQCNLELLQLSIHLLDSTDTQFFERVINLICVCAG
jgi:hypothetical protein